MTRYIDADALISDLEYDVELDSRLLDDTGLVGLHRELTQFDKDCKANTIAFLKEAPTVNAVPVKHGKWIDMDEQSYTWKIRCSCCDHERSMLSTQGTYPNYCENCGARMDEE